MDINPSSPPSKHPEGYNPVTPPVDMDLTSITVDDDTSNLVSVLSMFDLYHLLEENNFSGDLDKANRDELVSFATRLVQLYFNETFILPGIKKIEKLSYMKELYMLRKDYQIQKEISDLRDILTYTDKRNFNLLNLLPTTPKIKQWLNSKVTGELDQFVHLVNLLYMGIDIKLIDLDSIDFSNINSYVIVALTKYIFPQLHHNEILRYTSEKINIFNMDEIWLLKMHHDIPKYILMMKRQIFEVADTPPNRYMLCLYLSGKYNGEIASFKYTTENIGYHGYYELVEYFVGENMYELLNGYDPLTPNTFLGSSSDSSLLPHILKMATLQNLANILYGACKKGITKFVNYILDNYGVISGTEITSNHNVRNRMLEGACIGNQDIVYELLDKYSYTFEDLEKIAKICINYGNELIFLLLDKLRNQKWSYSPQYIFGKIKQLLEDILGVSLDKGVLYDKIKEIYSNYLGTTMEIHTFNLPDNWWNIVNWEKLSISDIRQFLVVNGHINVLHPYQSVKRMASQTTNIILTEPVRDLLRSLRIMHTPKITYNDLVNEIRRNKRALADRLGLDMTSITSADFEEKVIGIYRYAGKLADVLTEVEDTKRKLLLNTNYLELRNTCYTSREYAKICNNYWFWEQKVLNDFYDTELITLLQEHISDYRSTEFVKEEKGLDESTRKLKLSKEIYAIMLYLTNRYNGQRIDFKNLVRILCQYKRTNLLLYFIDENDVYNKYTVWLVSDSPYLNAMYNLRLILMEEGEEYTKQQLYDIIDTKLYPLLKDNKKYYHNEDELLKVLDRIKNNIRYIHDYPKNRQTYTIKYLSDKLIDSGEWSKLEERQADKLVKFVNDNLTAALQHSSSSGNREVLDFIYSKVNVSPQIHSKAINSATDIETVKLLMNKLVILREEHYMNITFVSAVHGKEEVVNYILENYLPNVPAMWLQHIMKTLEDAKRRESEKTS